jgi:RNA polymerase sigma factor (sigma-70 family)
LDRVSHPAFSSGNFEAVVEKKDLITQLLKDLHPVYRTIVVLFYQQGLDIREIAEITERPIGTIKAYLHRARAQMRATALELSKTSRKY